MTTSRRRAALCALGALLFCATLTATGCNGKAQQQAFGDKPQDWQRSTPPPGWHGPGDPASSGKMRAPSGPPAGKTP